MTTTKNKSVSPDAIHKAMTMAQNTGDNIVVYKAEIAKKKQEVCVPERVWKQAKETIGIEFLAIIDADGNYVD